MKKYLSILLLTAFIVPSVALASWWNPLSWFHSWSFSGKTDTRTEVLDKSIRELEDKRGGGATTSKATSTQSVVTATTTATTTPVVKKEIKKTTPVVDNSAIIRAQVEATLKAKVDQNALLAKVQEQVDHDTLIAKQKVEEQAKSDALKAAEQANTDVLKVESDRQAARQIEADRIKALNAQREKDAEIAAQQQMAQQAIRANTTSCNGTNWNKCPIGQDFVCPATGNAYCQYPPSQSAPQQTQTQPSTQDTAKAAALLSEYKSQVAAINQQILDIKQKYYSDVAEIEKEPGMNQGFKTGYENNLLTKANRQIEQLNLQIDQLRLDYNNKISAI